LTKYTENIVNQVGFIYKIWMCYPVTPKSQRLPTTLVMPRLRRLN